MNTSAVHCENSRQRVNTSHIVPAIHAVTKQDYGARLFDHLYDAYLCYQSELKINVQVARLASLTFEGEEEEAM